MLLASTMCMKKSLKSFQTFFLAILCSHHQYRIRCSIPHEKGCHNSSYAVGSHKRFFVNVCNVLEFESFCISSRALFASEGVAWYQTFSQCDGWLNDEKKRSLLSAAVESLRWWVKYLLIVAKQLTGTKSLVLWQLLRTNSLSEVEVLFEIILGSFQSLLESLLVLSINPS